MPLWIHPLTIGDEQPKFAVCDDDTDYITNGEFETDTSGWTGGTREADSSTPLGDYSFKISSETVQTTCTVTGALGSRSFVVSFFAKSATATATVMVGDESFSITGLSSSAYKERAVIKTFAHYREATSFLVKITSSGTLNIDGVKCYEVDTVSLGMPNPTYEELKHARELRPQTINGLSISALATGWRFYGYLKWPGLTLDEQAVVSALQNAEVIVYWPHSDEEDCASCRPSSSAAVMRYVFNSRFTPDDDEALLLEGLDLLFSESIITSGGS